MYSCARRTTLCRLLPPTYDTLLSRPFGSIRSEIGHLRPNTSCMWVSWASIGGWSRREIIPERTCLQKVRTYVTQFARPRGIHYPPTFLLRCRVASLTFIAVGISILFTLAICMLLIGALRRTDDMSKMSLEIQWVGFFALLSLGEYHVRLGADS